MTVAEVFQEISAADFFYRNRDIAGFTNPTRAIYSSVRELVENSLDACETIETPPDIYLRISHESGPLDGPGTYTLRVEDNGIGVPAEVIPSAFGQVLYGSKYKLRQTRGTFGLGGKMAILYGQITTHSEARIVSSTSPREKVTEVILRIDIQKNKPIVLRTKQHSNKKRWRGTIIEIKTEADCVRAIPKILEYLKQTAIIVPYANITFVDPRGRLYRFLRGTTRVPKAPEETLPHPYGVDVETVQRMLEFTKARTLRSFLTTHFQKIGSTTAQQFLNHARVESLKAVASKLGLDVRAILPGENNKGPREASEKPVAEQEAKKRSTATDGEGKKGAGTEGESETTTRNAVRGRERPRVGKLSLDEQAKILEKEIRKAGGKIESRAFWQEKNPSKLTPDDIVEFVNSVKTFEGLHAPDPSCLSPLGEDLLATGIRKELELTNEDVKAGSTFLVTRQREPSTYSGFPFIVEVGLACSKQIPTEGGILLFRFANKIPLLFDEASDVSWKVVNTLVDWRNYRVVPRETPLAVFVHVCSTKIPYKTVGKEFIADRPEVEHEILNAIREVGRKLKLYLSRREHLEQEKKKLDVFGRYLPKVAEFSTKLSKEKKVPDVSPLLNKVRKYGAEEK